jgi:peptidoglycan/xylan/chitin deacetylase (PgdA/CDA1 family)
MAALRDRGFQGIALGELLDAWDAGTSPWARPVVLTFDDAFANLAEHGAPVLRELGFRATVFAVAGYCGRTNAWPGQTGGVPILPLLSASELRDLGAAGIEVGSHGLTHAALDRLPRAEAEREVVESRHVLEEALGRPVRLFAYPYGAAGDEARALVGASYRAACSVEMGTALPRSDRHWLSRIDMYYFRDPGLFRHFGTPLGRAYVAARALGRRVKKTMASTAS